MSGRLPGEVILVHGLWYGSWAMKRLNVSLREAGFTTRPFEYASTSAALVVSKFVQVFTLFILTPATMLVAPVLAAEGAGPIAATRRSVQLARRRFGQLIALLFLLVLVNLLLSSALTTLPLLGAFLLDDWGWVAFFGLSLVSTSVLNVLGVGVSVLAYLDLRHRVEGLDLQRRLATLQHADEVARG